MLQEIMFSFTLQGTITKGIKLWLLEAQGYMSFTSKY